MSEKTATIQARVSDEDKKEAQANLRALGLDLSTYINMSIKALNREHALPFTVALTPTAMLAQSVADVKAGNVSAPMSLADYLKLVDGDAAN